MPREQPLGASRDTSPIDVFQEVLNISGTVENGNDVERHAGWIVHNQVREDAPELHGSVGEVLAPVAQFGRLGQLIEGLLQGIPDAEGSGDAIVGDKRADRVDVLLRVRRQPVAEFTRASSLGS